MTKSLSADLYQRLEAYRRDDPNARLQFVVTLRPGAGVASVAGAGMRVDQQIAEPPLLLGTMTAKQALAVAQLDDVVRVELDEGGMHALEDPD